MKMKKIILLLLASIMLTSSLSGCKSQQLKIRDYISYEANTVYEYKGTGAEQATQTIYMDYIDKEKELYQRSIIAADYRVVECVAIKDEVMGSYFVAPQCDSLTDMRDTDLDDLIPILVEPLVKGTKWERGFGEMMVGDDQYEVVTRNAEITGVNVPIEVPYGKFKALEITITTEGNDEQMKEYYVEGIGLVKNVQYIRVPTYDPVDNIFQGEEYIDVVSELESIKKDTNYVAERYFFYPGNEIGKTSYEKRMIEHGTGEDVNELFEKELKNYSQSDIKSIIGADTKINSIDFNFDELKVKIDFSSNLLSELTQKGEREMDYIQSIVNSTGYFFGVSRICITVDGKGYDGGVKFGDDEYINIEVEIDMNEDDEELTDI